MRRGRSLLLAVGVAGAALLASGVQGLADLDQRLATETAKPKPVKLDSAPHERPRVCPERDDEPPASRREV